MTDHIPADKVRKIVNDMRRHADHDAVRGREEEYVGQFADLLESLLPAPPRPTLADMTEEERRACQWMQCDVETWGRAVIVLHNAGGGRAVTLNRRGHMAYEDHTDVTPRPDLPRMTWPGTEKPAPAPALPDGWRLADHPDHGRVIVTNTTPNRGGHVCYVLPASEDGMGYDWHFCDPDELTYIDQEADQ